MKIQPTNLIFKGKPENYAKIDYYLSRSAQPMRDDFIWLKNRGVTDIINFRTMHNPKLDFDEKTVVESLGMKYHNIPTTSAAPEENKIFAFLELIQSIKNNQGKAHLHCKAGADRTGMYSFIYKGVNKIGDIRQNEVEWLMHGHRQERYPEMISWAENILQKLIR